MIAGGSSVGGARTECRDVLSDSTTKLKTMVLWEGSDPEPCHVHFSSEFQSKCGRKESGRWRWSKAYSTKENDNDSAFLSLPSTKVCEHLVCSKLPARGQGDSTPDRDDSFPTELAGM